MMRTSGRASVLLLATLSLAAPASAQVVQSIHFGGGMFLPRGFDSRVVGDVLVEGLTTTDRFVYEKPGAPSECRDRVTSCLKAFRGAPFFGEWNFGFGERIEVGVGASFYSRKVASLYRDLVNGHFTDTPADDTEIQQTIGLRAVPITGLVRFLPVGRAGTVQPYVGVGISAVNFRYSEIGDFVDASDGAIFNERYIETGTAVGPVLVGGLRVPIKGDIYALTIEGRYQWATGDISGLDANGNQKFLTNKIDLGGGNINFGFLIRF